MADTSTEALTELGRAMMQSMASMFGSSAADAFIREHTRQGEIAFTRSGELEVFSHERETKEIIAVLVAAAIARTVQAFGRDFTERMLERIVAGLKRKFSADGPDLLAALSCIPDGFLEREKIRLLSKDELEERVLQRTRELKEANENLEATVLARTKELVAANKELERLSRAKTEFLSLVSHQLLVPLTAVRWIAAALEESLGTDARGEQKKFLADLFSTNERMVRLVGNLLNVARIEEGRMSYKFESIDVGALARSVVSALDPLAKEKGIVLTYRQAPESCRVRADPEKLYLALENIVENAIKYTDAGREVRVDITRDRAMISIAVRDQGIGVPPEESAHIFEKFFRARNARLRSAGGSGLGLFIVRQIVEDHGGHARFESIPSAGTSFFIELPGIA